MRNPFYSVLALIVHLFSLAVLFLLLSSAFVAAAQVVVYAGAVMVLYVFVVAYVGGGEESAWEPIPGQRFLAPLLGIAALRRALDRRPRPPRCSRSAPTGPTSRPGFGDPAEIGRLLLERFLHPLRGHLDPAPARRGRRDRARGPHAPPEEALERPMSIEWYVVLSSLLFAIGAVGILIRRSPVVILLCLELMLNAGNLALVAFSRMVGNQEGQVFATRRDGRRRLRGRRRPRPDRRDLPPQAAARRR